MVRDLDFASSTMWRRWRFLWSVLWILETTLSYLISWFEEGRGWRNAWYTGSFLSALDITIQAVWTEKKCLILRLVRHVRLATEARSPQKLPEKWSIAAWLWWQFWQVYPWVEKSHCLAHTAHGKVRITGLSQEILIRGLLQWRKWLLVLETTKAVTFITYKWAKSCRQLLFSALGPHPPTPAIILTAVASHTGWRYLNFDLTAVTGLVGKNRLNKKPQTSLLDIEQGINSPLPDFILIPF